MKHAIRRLLVRNFKQVMTLGCRWLPVNGVRVLGYHSIADHPSELCVSPADFENQLLYIKSKGFESLPIKDFTRIAEERREVRNKLLITFDDGYLDFLELAVPILKKHGMHATVFVSPEYVGQSPGWLIRDRQRIVQLINSFPFSEASRKQLIEWNDQFATRALMNWQQLREVIQLGFDVQSHSLSHHFLTEVEPAQLLQDLKSSREQIETELRYPVHSIAYPYGDCNDVVFSAVKQAGYRIGFASVPHPSVFPYRIGRTQIGGSEMTVNLRYLLSAASSKSAR